MRRAFAESLAGIGQRDERVVLLTGDLGFMALDPYIDACPERFINAGVAEQNMVGVATGLAEAGMVPFVYSIVTFATLRPYEFIRNGPVLHGLPVRVVGIGGGFEYGHAGPTHFGLEDVGVMRSMEGITIVAPADARQARAAIEQTWDIEGPVYYRLGKDDSRVVPGLDGRFELGRADQVRAGSDVLLVVMGSIAAEGVAAAELARERFGIDVEVVVVASVSPAPVEDLVEACSRHDRVVTLEAHNRNGGLGSLVAEVVAESGAACQLRRLAVSTAPDGISGSEFYMWSRHGLDRESVATALSRIVDVAGVS